MYLRSDFYIIGTGCKMTSVGGLDDSSLMRSQGQARLFFFFSQANRGVFTVFRLCFERKNKTQQKKKNSVFAPTLAH